MKTAKTFAWMGVSDKAQVGDKYEIDIRGVGKVMGKISRLYPYYPASGEECIYHSTKVILADVTVMAGKEKKR